MRLARPVNVLLYLVCVALLGVAALEGATRFLKPLPPLPSVNEIGWNAINSLQHFTLTADRSFIADPARESNQLLLRGRPFTAAPAGKTRVLLVGDSQVEGAALPFGEMPEVELERRLNSTFSTDAFEVRSIAAGGWGQDQQLLALRRYYDSFRADYVLLWHTPRNDYWENAFPDRSTNRCLGALKPTFVLGADGLQPFDFAPYDIGTSPLAHSVLYRRVIRILERWGVCRESQLHRGWDRLLPSPHGHVAAARGACPDTVVDQYDFSAKRAADGFAPVTFATAEDFQDSRSHFSPYLEHMSTRDEYLLALTQALLREIARTAGSHRSEFIVFMNHQTYRDGAADVVPAGSCLIHAENRYRLADLPSRVRGVFAGMTFIELVARHPEVSIDDVTIAPRDRHMNAAGDRLVFEELVAQLVQKKLIRPKSRPPRLP